MKFLFLGEENNDLVNFEEVVHVNKGHIGDRPRISIELKSESAITLYYSSDKKMLTDWFKIENFLNDQK